jgi:hypothetical protein
MDGQSYDRVVTRTSRGCNESTKHFNGKERLNQSARPPRVLKHGFFNANRSAVPIPMESWGSSSLSCWFSSLWDPAASASAYSKKSCTALLRPEARLSFIFRDISADLTAGAGTFGLSPLNVGALSHIAFWVDTAASQATINPWEDTSNQESLFATAAVVCAQAGASAMSCIGFSLHSSALPGWEAWRSSWRFYSYFSQSRIRPY